jgi:elongator complex protein 2
LASGSQDNYIRLWRIARLDVQAPSTSSLDAAVAEITLDSKTYPFSLGKEKCADERFTVLSRYSVLTLTKPSGSFSCSSEAVLFGHENWVTGLRWRPSTGRAPKPQGTTLLSTSADQSMIIWEVDPSTSLWMPKERFGDLSGIGGGFFGASWGKDGCSVLAHDWGGSFRIWRLNDGETWVPAVGIGGHFAAVRSLDWEPEGTFLVSVR